jgi:antiphage defense system Thoeris ThsB-like protein
MARRVFFSFHYDKDVWRANQVRNSNMVAGTDTAGFFDHSEYEEAEKTGGDGIRQMILKHLKNTSVTVVLIGVETAHRPWVQYEIEQSAQKNGLLGIYIHHLKDQNGNASPFRGEKPTVPYGTYFPAYEWDKDLERFKQEIEAAGNRSDVLRATR